MKNFFKKIIVAILQWEARLVLRKYKPNIIAVTGNIGKTSTKDAIYHILNKAFFVRKSKKSFNSEIGLPLAIFDCPTGWNNPVIWIGNIFEGLKLIFLKNHFPDWLVLEVGADKPDDIKKVAKWLKPDIVVVSKFAKIPVHIEFFKSRDHLINEKASLVEELEKGGLLVVNGDDEDSLSMREKTKNKSLIYGFGKNADIRASNQEFLYNKKGQPSGTSFRLDYKSNSIPFAIEGTVGKQHTYSILSAVAVGISLDLNLIQIAEWFRDYKTPNGRLKILEGINNSTIIDDSYNSSPSALRASLNVLKQIKTNGQKIAVIGDMLELGKHSVEAHKEIGKFIHEDNIADILITVGIHSQAIANEAMKSGMEKEKIKSFDDSVSAGEYISGIIKQGDIVLVKGSQSTRTEKTIEKIMTHPEEKLLTLIRQDPYWLGR